MEPTASGGTFASAFDPRHNSFNAIRLFLTVVVLVFHSWQIGGFGDFAVFRYDVGSIAVDGFFVISGFMIARSRASTPSVGRYAWHRFLRIYPAFWVCLILTAGVFGAAAWTTQHGNIAGYFSAPHGPLRYVIENATIKMRFYDVSGTPVNPYLRPGGALADKWDGSLWTLYWEVLCYIGLAALAGLGALTRRRWLVLASLATLLMVALVTNLDADGVLSTSGSTYIFGFGRFGVLFLAGVAAWLWADRIPMSSALAAISAALVVLSCTLRQPSLLEAIPLAYLCVWAGIRLPFHRVGQRADLSYGIYIYAFPVQQLLALRGWPSHGFAVYLLATVVVTLPLAYASWMLVERPAMRRKSSPPRWLVPAPAVSGVASD